MAPVVDSIWLTPEICILDTTDVNIFEVQLLKSNCKVSSWMQNELSPVVALEQSLWIRIGNRHASEQQFVNKNQQIKQIWFVGFLTDKIEKNSEMKFF